MLPQGSGRGLEEWGGEGGGLLLAHLVYVNLPPPPVKSSSSGGTDAGCGGNFRWNLPLKWDPKCPGGGGGGGGAGGGDVAMGEAGGFGCPQNDSSCPTERWSPLGVEARDEPLSMLSEPELWCCCSEAVLDVMVDEEVDEERLFSLKSVMITVTLPTVMASCWAVLRSTFFSLGLEKKNFVAFYKFYVENVLKIIIIKKINSN